MVDMVKMIGLQVMPQQNVICAATKKCLVSMFISTMGTISSKKPNVTVV